MPDPSPKKCKKHGVTHKNGGYASCVYESKEEIPEWEKKFNEGFVWEEGIRNGIYTPYIIHEDGTRQLALPEYFKAFIRQAINQTLEEAAEALEKTFLHKARHTNDQNIYNSGVQNSATIIRSLKK